MHCPCVFKQYCNKFLHCHQTGDRHCNIWCGVFRRHSSGGFRVVCDVENRLFHWYKNVFNEITSFYHCFACRCFLQIEFNRGWDTTIYNPRSFFSTCHFDVRLHRSVNTHRWISGVPLIFHGWNYDVRVVGMVIQTGTLWKMMNSRIGKLVVLLSTFCVVFFATLRCKLRDKLRQNNSTSESILSLPVSALHSIQQNIH